MFQAFPLGFYNFWIWLHILDCKVILYWPTMEFFHTWDPIYLKYWHLWYRLILKPLSVRVLLKELNWQFLLTVWRDSLNNVAKFIVIKIITQNIWCLNSQFNDQCANNDCEIRFNNCHTIANNHIYKILIFGNCDQSVALYWILPSNTRGKLYL